MLRGIRRVRAEAKGITSQEKYGFQRKRTTCISSWIKRRGLREKKKRRKETEGRRRVQVLRGNRDDASGHEVSLVTVATMNIRAAL